MKRHPIEVGFDCVKEMRFENFNASFVKLFRQKTQETLSSGNTVKQ
jgi:hypothetical protein